MALIRGRVRFPKEFKSLPVDERDEFRRSRYAIGDTLLDAAAVLGGEGIIRLLLEPLQQLSAAVAAGTAFDWRAAEAALYCVR